ncbi:MAG: BREX-1 system adenine-specific DNA-methyltransferase PglX [Selenomonadaceae bacterium]|nr:BREX-1 system adenine-specific DNA-methyltransferase PglX [Selenomonadaceae bacterium]
MNKTAIKNFAIWARNKLIEDITYQMRLIGIDKEGIKEKLPQSTADVEFYDIGTRDPYQVAGMAVGQRRALANHLKQQARESDFATAYENVIEEVAYTWFNRLIAIRFMEVNDYLPGGLRVLSSSSVSKIEPELVTTPFESDLEFTPEEREQILEWQENNKTDDLFRLLFIKECNALHAYLPELFEKTTDYTELLLSLSVTNPDGVVAHLVSDIPEEDFNVEAGGQVEIIGWLYQYYNTEPKAKVFARPSGQKIKKEEIPAATQLFTPDWIVRYMVQNSLGRMWVEGHEADPEKLNWQYYLPEAEQEPEVAEKLARIREEYKSKKIEDIKFLDPCMGSGHILVYAFEVFMQLYLEQGYDERDAAESILTNNLYGLDIDRRAFQLAYFALFMKAREYNRRILTKGIELHICAVEESNGLEDAIEELHIPEDSLIASTVEAFEDAKEYGSILNIPAEDYEEVREYVQDLDEGDNLFVAAAVGELKKRVPALVKQAEIMSRKYEVVVTNPPYMGGGMSTKLSDFVKKHYADSKSDLFAVCIERCNNWVMKNGYNCMVTMQSWMFLSSFEKIREKILDNTTITNLMHMDNMVMGIAFGTAVTVWKKCKIEEYKGIYHYVKMADIVDDKPCEFPIKRNSFVNIAMENFTKIPGSPLAYWASEKVISSFQNNSISKFAISNGQNITGDNNRFLRFFWEIDFTNVRNDYWAKCARGGGYRRYYGNDDNTILWTNSAREHYRKDKIARIVPENLRFKEGITWSYITSGKPSFRRLWSYELFEKAGSSVFIKDSSQINPLLGLLNSKVSTNLLSIITPTINYQVRDILLIPIFSEVMNNNRVTVLTQQNIVLSKSDWDSFETSWDFKRHPLV